MLKTMDKGSERSVDQPIAILDSGVGGLTVVKEVMRQLPQESIVYFGDTARAPYGSRTSDEVIRFTHQIIDFLELFHPKMIVIACNTATAAALGQVRARLSVPVVGVIHPGARAAIKKSRKQLIGVIGTEGTIRSKAYETALKQISPQLEAVSLACPEFVPLVESGQFEGEAAREIVEQALSGFKQLSMDCLILGCTHYPFIANAIAEVMGPDVQLINSAEETAREMSAVLFHRGLLAKGASHPEHKFFCSGDIDLFKRIAERWLHEPVGVSSVVWPMPHTL